MHDLQVFSNSEFGSVRTCTMNGAPYFVGKDVADILGYTNPAKALQDHVDDEDKLNNESLSSLGQRGGWLINESGLYSLILRSQLPKAKQFKRWVTSEVLPSIRKHGVYAVDEVLKNPDILISALTELKKEREEKDRLALETAIQKQQIAEMHPKVDYHDKVLACPDLVKVTTIAKDYGWSARKMNDYLQQKKIQFKQGEQWILYQKYAEQGFTQSFTYNYTRSDGSHGNNMITKWTQKGRLFIYHLLKDDGVLPCCERG